MSINRAKVLAVASVIVLVSILAWGGQGAAKSPPAKVASPAYGERTKWEFKHIDFTMQGYGIESVDGGQKAITAYVKDRIAYEESLNKAGQEGWELVSVVAYPAPGSSRYPSQTVDAYLKRQVLAK